MKIKYKEPYWVKFEWEIDEHHDNQYVTSFDKTENKIFNQLFHKNEFLITINFKIKSHYKKDDISMVFGKPGKNLGLAYNSETKQLTFEFWTEDKFYQDVFKDVTQKEIETGVIISVGNKNNEFILFYDDSFCLVVDQIINFHGIEENGRNISKNHNHFKR